MTIIVTGGAGFIGGNFVHYMLEKYPEDRIVCVDGNKTPAEIFAEITLNGHLIKRPVLLP